MKVYPVVFPAPTPLMVISFTVADPFTGLQFDWWSSKISALSILITAGVLVIAKVVVVEHPLLGVAKSVTRTV